MIATGGTIVSAAEMLTRRGARRVWAAATHAIFAGDAVRKLERAPLERVIVTDSLPLPPSSRFEGLVVLSVAPLLADAIRAIFADASVSEISGGLNERF